MKKKILVFAFMTIGVYAFAQSEAEKLIGEGVELHDQGKYSEAITRYDQALTLEPDNLTAASEKALTLNAMQKYNDAISICKKLIEKHQGEKSLKTVFVTYGNSLDGLQKTEESLRIYNEGISQFPYFYQLYFNKGITLSGVHKLDEALASFETSVKLNANHASSHNAIARIMQQNHKKIPSVLAFSRFFILEPQSQRAKSNLEIFRNLIDSNIEKNGKNGMTITISADALSDTTAEGKPKENSFTSADLIMSLTSALDVDKKNRKKSEAELFEYKFSKLCAVLSETKKDNYGFFWDYYTPYFIELNDKKFTETFSYLVFASSEDKDVIDWLKKHKKEIDQFYEWSTAYLWQ